MRLLPEPDPGAPDCRSPLRYLVWLTTGLRVPILFSVAFGILFMVCQALMPAAIGRALDHGLIARDRGALLLWGAALLGLAAVQAAASIAQDRWALTASLGASFRSTQLVTGKSSALGASLRRQVPTGEVVGVATDDIGALGRAFDVVGRAAGSAAVIAAVAAIMISTSWRLGLVVLLGVPLMLWVTGLLVRPLHRRKHRVRDLQGELTGRAVDIASGLRVLRGIGGEEQFSTRYQEKSQQVRAAALRVARVEAALTTVTSLLPGLMLVIVIWLGARYVVAGTLSVGELVTFYGYTAYLALAMRRMSSSAHSLTAGYVAAGRIARILSLPEGREAAEPPRSTWPAAPGPLTDPVSALTAPPGRFTAVACASPCDASVLADRLGGYAGDGVTYGTSPLRDLPRDEVRRRVLVVDNDARLFSGPLRTELRTTADTSDPSEASGTADAAGASGASDTALLMEALDTAAARDIVDGLPHGLDTVIRGSGHELSGGQLQRLRLARALTVDPEVLILVEPTSAVDAHTEERIAARLTARRRGRTTLVFTTSPVMLGRADSVAFVERGRVVAEGTHAALLDDRRYRAVVAREENAA
ncbi:ABC transporter ATP-binding protein [Sinosporangium album]|nr:ABC transporter ATP-binding protein [Sinosporangium album]